MNRHRFYCPALGDLVSTAGGARPPGEVGGVIMSLDREESRHACRVLRLKDGAEVEVFDGRGVLGCGRLRVGKGSAAVVIEQVEFIPDLRPVIDMAVALPKGPRADRMVQQLSQAGIGGLIPLRAERSVFEPGGGRLDRLGVAAIEAAKQSGRAHMMRFRTPTGLQELLTENHGVCLLTDVMAKPLMGAAVTELGDRLRGAERVLILVGPEGGWTNHERSLACESGAIPWRLGPHVMRVETAALVAGSLARFLVGWAAGD